jgi:hypothetical protein
MRRCSHASLCALVALAALLAAPFGLQQSKASVFVGSNSELLVNAPLRVQGVDVGSALDDMRTLIDEQRALLLSATATLDKMTRRLSVAEATIEELLLRNADMGARLGDVEDLQGHSAVVTALLSMQIASNSSLAGAVISNAAVSASVASASQLATWAVANVSALLTQLAVSSDAFSMRVRALEDVTPNSSMIIRLVTALQAAYTTITTSSSATSTILISLLASNSTFAGQISQLQAGASSSLALVVSVQSDVSALQSGVPN